MMMLLSQGGSATRASVKDFLLRDIHIDERLDTESLAHFVLWNIGKMECWLAYLWIEQRRVREVGLGKITCRGSKQEGGCREEFRQPTARVCR